MRENRWLTRNQVETAINDTKQQWERVFITIDSKLDCLENLHKHPVEELIIEHSKRLRKKDILNICRCQTLKCLSIELAEIPEKLFSLFAALKNLEKIQVNAYDDDVPRQIAFLRQFPRLHFLTFHVFFRPMTSEEEAAIIEFIAERRESLRSFKWDKHFSTGMTSALVRCPNLTSFSIEVSREGQGDLVGFLSHPGVQNRIRHLSIWNLDISEEHSLCLADFNNLRSVELVHNNVAEKAVVKMILQNKKHIHTIKLNQSKKITEDILPALAQCTSLQTVALVGTLVPFRAINDYILDMRPNWEAIDSDHFSWDSTSNSGDSVDSTDSVDSWNSDVE